MPAKRAPRKEERVHALRIPDQRKNPPEIRAVFARCLEKIGFVPNVLRSYTLRPRKFELFRRYNNELMLGESGLSPLEREMIAVVVSCVNHCHYCLVAHGAQVRVLSGDPILGDQLVANYRAVSLSRRQRAMLGFHLEAQREPGFRGRRRPRGAPQGGLRRRRHLRHRRGRGLLQHDQPARRRHRYAPQPGVLRHGPLRRARR